ncbi:MAG: hypothetical protein D6784_17645, partial [Chloroflexi bacterium]
GWEAGGLSGSSVISDSGQYKMWYTAFDGSGVGRIGYATSPDGVTWSKYGSNPVLDVGAPGSWEDTDVMFPSVLKQGSTYHLWYDGSEGSGQGSHRIGHATSADGVNWTKDAANPVLDVGPSGDWDWLDTYGPNVIEYNNTFILWYSGHTLPTAWQTGYAISTDGTTWTRQEKLISQGAPGAFDSDSADFAAVIPNGTDFNIWYSGYNGTDYTIGYATAQVCSAAAPAPPASLVYLPIILSSGGSASCPAYYTDNFGDPGSGWLVSDTSERRYAYVGGEYQIWVKNPNMAWWVTPGAKATDFTASVSARRASGGSGGYGIIFGINEDGTQWYEFDIGVNSYSIWKYNNGYITPPLQDWTYSPAIATSTGSNRLKVIRQGSSISVYVNNQFLNTIIDSSFTGFRRIGLTVGAGSASNDVRFDNFALYPASCGVSAAGVGFEMGRPGSHGGPGLHFPNDSPPPN